MPPKLRRGVGRCAATRQTEIIGRNKKKCVRVATADPSNGGAGRVNRSAAAAIPRPQAIAQLAAASGSISLSNKNKQHQHEHQPAAATASIFALFVCCCCCCCCCVRPTRATAPARSAPSTPGAPTYRPCCCYNSMVELRRYTSCHAVAFYKHGGVNTSTSSPFGTQHPPRHQAGYVERTQQGGAGGPPAARWHNPTPLVRVVLQLHLSSLCAPSGCRVVYSKRHMIGGTCEGWKKLGVYNPRTCRAKIYRTFCQIPTFAEILFLAFFFNIFPPILPPMLCFGEWKYQKHVIANTLLQAKTHRPFFFFSFEGDDP